MERFKKYLKYTKNFYVMFTLGFLVWMIFIDSSNIISHIELRSKLGDLEEEKEYYLEKKKKIEQDRQELMSNYELLEKFARERYLMKKETEDLYVIIPED